MRKPHSMLDANSKEALLTGETSDGIPIYGFDSVRIVPGLSKGKK